MSYSDIAVVSVENAAIFQHHTPVLTDVHFTIHKGEFVYLIGKTGSGKSSLLKTLYADIELLSGEAEIVGFNLKKLRKKEVPYLRRKIGIVFQDFQLLTDRSVQENLLFVLKATGWSNKSKMRQRITEVLIQVGLSSSLNKYPHQLSGGEQQRITIARALLNEPILLIADEPTGNLDPDISEDILKLFLDINRSGTAVLMATHNYDFIKKFPARTLVCQDHTLIDRTSA